MVVLGSLQQCIYGVLQSLMAPSELIEGQLEDPTKNVPEHDETLLVCNPCKPSSSSAHCCGSHHMSGFHGLGFWSGFHDLGF